MDNTLGFIGLSLAHWLHMLATVLWFGGNAFIGIILVPVLSKTLDKKDFGKVMGAVMGVFKRVVYISMLILGVTGSIIMVVDGNYEGAGQVSNLWSILTVIKHIIVILLIAVAVYNFQILGPKAGKAAATGSADAPKLQALQMKMAKIGSLLAISIILCTAFMMAI